jgi:hypothetical protein
MQHRRVVAATTRGWARCWALDGLAFGLIIFYFFIFINRGGQLVRLGIARLGKSMIYRDLSIEADWLPVSVNPFYPSQ